jgi:hypothetical protein
MVGQQLAKPSQHSFLELWLRAELQTAQNIDWLSLAAIFSEHGLPMGEYREFNPSRKRSRRS